MDYKDNEWNTTKLLLFWSTTDNEDVLKTFEIYGPKNLKCTRPRSNFLKFFKRLKMDANISALFSIIANKTLDQE